VAYFQNSTLPSLTETEEYKAELPWAYDAANLTIQVLRSRYNYIEASTTARNNKDRLSPAATPCLDEMVILGGDAN
jgi:hypothetical protein